MNIEMNTFYNVFIQYYQNMYNLSTNNALNKQYNMSLIYIFSNLTFSNRWNNSSEACGRAEGNYKPMKQNSKSLDLNNYLWDRVQGRSKLLYFRPEIFKNIFSR